MVLTRAFEENAERDVRAGKVHGTMHLSIGQEAIAAGASSAITPQRLSFEHPSRVMVHFLAWGGDLKRMMSEFLGKENGYCRGRGGSMHIAVWNPTNLGANGIVAGNLLSLGCWFEQ